MCRYAQFYAFISVIELPRIPAYRPKKVMTFKKKFGMSPKNYKTHKEMMDKYNEKQIDDPV